MPSPLRDGRDWRAALVPGSVLRIVPRTGAGILTCPPSATPFGLALGPDSPWADLPSPGNLRLTANGILTRFIVYSFRHSHLPALHGLLLVPLRRARNALLPSISAPTASVSYLVPFIIGAGLLDQSA